MRVVLNDGASHSVDSSDIAFQIAGRKAFREVYPKAKPVVLEPVMKLEVESPTEFQGAILKTVMQRRGTVVGTTEEDGFCRVEAEVPLAEMFGYSTDLRSCTQGKAEFTMEFARYVRVPGEVQKELVEEVRLEAGARRRRRREASGGRSLEATIPERAKPAAPAREGTPRRPRRGQPRRRARGPRRRQDVVPGRRRGRRAAARGARAARLVLRTRSPTCARTTTPSSTSSRSSKHLENDGADPRRDRPRAAAIRVYPPNSLTPAKLRDAVKLEREAGGAPSLIVLEGLDLA